ncbi:MAG: efflux RND transporter periplasmic adaptor subunit [Magnetospiraceae bacterium]
MKPAFFFALAALALPSMAIAQDSTPATGPFTVVKSEVEDRKAVFATVETVDVSVARARIGGTVTELTVDEGSAVKAGEQIAKVVDPKLDLERDVLNARIEAIKASQSLAQIDLERTQRLRASGTVSQARLDEAQTNLEVIDRNLRAMNAERELLDERLREGAVFAPADGRVLKVDTAAGQVVLTGEAVATLADETYVLRMQVPERHARFIEAGQMVAIGARGLTTDNTDGHSEGKIIKVYPEIDGGRVVADILAQGLGTYFVGERATVFVNTGSRTTILVPPDYLYRRFGLTFVRVQDAGEVVVEPGMMHPGGVEILSGLREGDILIPRSQE